MLACIACLKKEHEDDSDGAKNSVHGATNKGGAKSLASQIKQMVLKFSGQCKGGGRSAYYNKCNYEDTSASYLRGASTCSTQPWEFGRFDGGTSSMRFLEDMMVLDEEDKGVPKEWITQVEPGVHITFVSIPNGTGNDLKRIRFDREMFNKWQAQLWWGENYDRIMELYNVHKFSRQALNTPSRSLNTPSRSDDGNQRESFYSRVESFIMSSPATTTQIRDHSSVPDPSEHMIMDTSRLTRSSAASLISMSNTSSDPEIREWVEQDEPGVFITIRQHPDGSRELRRVRFSREMFGEVHAKLYWEENRDRIQSQYL